MSRVNSALLPLNHSSHLGVAALFGAAEVSCESSGKIFVWSDGTPFTYLGISRCRFLGKHITPTAPTLLNSWANFGSPYEPAGYYKDSNGLLILKGCLDSGSSGTNLFQLPSGYYDQTYNHRFGVFSDNAGTPVAGQVDLLNTGYVYMNSGGTTRFHLDDVVTPLGASWTTPSFFYTTWSNLGGSWAPVGYCVIDNVVHLRGMCVPGTNSLIFLLPAQYRPSKNMTFATVSDLGVTEVIIGSSGSVAAINFAGTSWVSLDGISFPLDDLYDMPKLNETQEYDATYFDGVYCRKGDLTYILGTLANNYTNKYWLHMPTTPKYTYPDVTGGDQAHLEDYTETMDFGNEIRGYWSKSLQSWSITDPDRDTINIYKEHMDDLRNCVDLVDYGGSSFTFTDSTITKGVTELKAAHINEVRQNIDDAGLFAKCAGDCTSYCGTNCSSACMVSCVTSCYTDCSTDCQSGCTTTCRDSCSYNCDSSCTSSCNSNCLGSCGASSCGGTCASSCSYTCFGACNTTCQGGFFLPHGICTEGCWGNCAAYCYGGCTGACASGCDYSCYASCSTNCHTTCSYVCGASCTAACQSDCSEHCYTNCTTECGVNCTASCLTDCDTGCVGNCYNSCLSSCYSSCSFTARIGTDAGGL